MQGLRTPYFIKSVDIRSLLGVSPPTLNDIYKKLGIEFPGSQNRNQGAVRHIVGPEVRRILEARGYQFSGRDTIPKVISFLMCKGGVGKTTSVFFLSQRFSAYGAKVLAIDADSQGNLTSAFNLEDHGFVVDASTPVLLDILTDKCTIEDTIVPVTDTLHLIPSTPINANLEGRIREQYKNPSIAIRNVLSKIKDQYDFVLIDCAPALNLVNTAVTCASDMIILPVAPDKFSQLGLDQTLTEIAQIENDFGMAVKKRIIFTKYDAREFTSLKYLGDTANQHKDKIFNTAIRTCADVKNVIAKREDLFMLKKSNAKEDFDLFAKEILGLDTFFGSNRRSKNN